LVAGSLVMFSLAAAAQESDRSRIPDRLKWNLSDIYPTDAAWRAAKEKLAAEIPSLRQFQGKLGSSPATLADALDRLGPWLARLDGFAALPDATRLIVEVALHELCANAIEHGQAQEPLELAWVPGAGAGRTGWFLLRDRGLPFHPARRQPWDAEHHPAWELGRGLGLELVHRILANVVFRPGTPEGNVTMMSFDPLRALAPKEQHHG